MHWLKYVIKGVRKGRLKNMHATTLEVITLADVTEAQCDFECLLLCDWAPLTWTFTIPFGSTGLWLVNKMLMAPPLNLDDLLWITSQDVNLLNITIFCIFFLLKVYQMDIC